MTNMEPVKDDAPQNKGQHIISLLKELLDDIEMSRLSAEALLLKVARLARLCESEEIRTWINYELRGYNNSDEMSLRYMSNTGRWTDYDKREGFWGSFAQIDESIQTSKLRMQTMQLPNLSGEYLTIALREVMTVSGAINSNIIKLSGIRSRVLAIMHEYVSRIFYEKVFSGLAENIFERYKNHIDPIISEKCGDVLTKLPSVFDRLSEGNAEAISQALTTLRRMIDAFADAIYPPSEKEIILGGNKLALGAQHYKNRINAYIASHTESDSRRNKLRQDLSNIYERLSAGVHNEVSLNEARSLVLSTYLFLGEVIEIQ